MSSYTISSDVSLLKNQQNNYSIKNTKMQFMSTLYIWEWVIIVRKLSAI